MQKTYTGSLPAGKTDPIFKRKMSDTSSLRIQNTDDAVLVFAFGPNKIFDPAVAAVKYTAPAHSDITVPVADLGATAVNTFFAVHNSSADAADGAWTVDILKADSEA